MGLDISAYRGLKVIGERDDENDDTINLMENADCFVARAEGVDITKGYSAEDSVSFRAGSYSGYNAWREELAKLAGYPVLLDMEYRQHPTHSTGAWASGAGPFWELINFSDCEGTIGPVVAAKLATDFARWDARAALHKTDDQGYWYQKYQAWRAAFEMASDRGAVVFH